MTHKRCTEEIDDHDVKRKRRTEEIDDHDVKRTRRHPPSKADTKISLHLIGQPIPREVSHAEWEREKPGHLKTVVERAEQKLKKGDAFNTLDACMTLETVLQAVYILHDDKSDSWIFEDPYKQACFDTLYGMGQRLRSRGDFEIAAHYYQWCWSICVDPNHDQLPLNGVNSDYNEVFVRRTQQKIV